MVGGPRRSKEQSLPAYPFSQVQFPNYLKERQDLPLRYKIYLMLRICKHT